MDNQEKTDKPLLAMWDYQNTTEDFDRRIILDVTNLMTNPENTEEYKQRTLAMMDSVIKIILEAFNVTPKSAEFENRIRNDSK